jgi:tol-pal system protein YbgF
VKSPFQPWIGRAGLCTALLAMLMGSSCLRQQEMLNSKVESQDSELQAIKDQISSLKKEVDARQDLYRDLEERVKQERADMQVTVEDLRTEVQQVRGTHDEMQHNLDLVKNDVQRLRSEQQKNQEKTIGAAAVKDENDVMVYDRALKAIRDQKDYDLAINKFKEFIERFPKSSLADNAIYWIGEANYAQQKYNDAIIEFQNLIEKFPKSDKVCGALLKQSLCFDSLNESAKSKLFLEETASRCKDQAEGKVAVERLAALKVPKAASPKK